MLDLKIIDKSWTLFLDRDGVINHEKKLDYVYNYGEFVFYDGVTKAINILTPLFGKIILVTNQRGIGKGLMTEADLADIHQKMLRDIKKGGGNIDLIVYCTAVDDSDVNRKPNPGMALQAKSIFPDITFSKSIMVGNNLSDMRFGKNTGMHTVLVKTTNPHQELQPELVDLVFKNLLDFAVSLRDALL